MIPTDRDCLCWWDAYHVPDHIRRHSMIVADVAEAVARRGSELGVPVDVQTVRASALLHDLAKLYTINWGGSHAQIGASWAMELTGNPVLAQGIAHHVYWPFELDVVRFFMPLAVLYADKRAMHDQLIGVAGRFDDLIERYGRTEEIRVKIRRTYQQSVELEDALNELLKVDLDACAFDRGRLVQRA